VKKWTVEKRDGKILRLLLEARSRLKLIFQEIVKDAGRSEKSVYSTLRRLEDRGEVHEVRDGWNLGLGQNALTLANIEQQMAMPSRWGGNRFNRGRT